MAVGFSVYISLQSFCALDPWNALWCFGDPVTEAVASGLMEFLVFIRSAYGTDLESRVWFRV